LGLILLARQWSLPPIVIASRLRLAPSPAALTGESARFPTTPPNPFAMVLRYVNSLQRDVINVSKARNDCAGSTCAIAFWLYEPMRGAGCPIHQTSSKREGARGLDLRYSLPALFTIVVVHHLSSSHSVRGLAAITPESACETIGTRRVTSTAAECGESARIVSSPLFIEMDRAEGRPHLRQVDPTCSRMRA
jgi:hypothetical protein